MMIMTPQEYLDYLKKRYHTYAYLKSSLADCRSKETFDKCAKELLEEVFNDEKMYFEFSTSNNVIPPVLQKEYESVSAYSQKVVQFFTFYKQLNF